MSQPDDTPPQSLRYSQPTRKTGEERFREAGQAAASTVLEFWRWSASDLLSNATRGVLAEYIVATALGVADGVRAEWDAYDLVTAEGTKVEVKSSAYIQGWAQNKLYSPSFRIAPTAAWSAVTGKREAAALRQADVYVFCVLAEKDPNCVDPLDLSQWDFYVLPTRVLDATCPVQQSIALSRLAELGALRARYDSLPESVRAAGDGG